MTSEGGRFRQYVSLARDLVISATGLAYFIGFVYVYYYFDKFGLGVLDSTPDAQLVFVFAWEVIRQDYRSALTIVLGVLAFGFCFNYAIEALGAPALLATRMHGTLHMLRLPLSDSRLLERLLRLLGYLIVIIPVFLMFLVLSLLFSLARNAASIEANDRYYAVHAKVRTIFSLLENVPGEHPVPGFNCFLRRITAASAAGRAIKVAETSDRVIFLVGAEDPKDLDHPRKRDINDHVYIIQKSLIAVEDRWSN